MTATNDQIDRQAADWAAKTEYGDVPPLDRPAFERWLAQDVRHRGAFMKALAVQVHLAKIGRANSAIAPRGISKTSRFAISRMTIAIAAALLIMIMGGGLVWTTTETHSYVTPVGTVQVLSLPDGSAVTLNTGSKVEVDYALASRNIVLPQGEALFDVAKNRLRPFRVMARGTRVRAVGTSFSVKNVAKSPVEVLVREGVVSLEVPSADGVHDLQVAAGRRAIINHDGSVQIERVSDSEVTNALAWRQGYIFLARRTLSEAATEFARYSPTKIIVNDPEIARRVVSGLFKANDPVSFAKATALSLHLEVEQKDGTVRLTKIAY